MVGDLDGHRSQPGWRRLEWVLLMPASPQPQLCSLQVGEGNTTAVRLLFQAHWLLPDHPSLLKVSIAVLSTLSAAYSLGLRSHPAYVCILLDLSHVSPTGECDNCHPLLSRAAAGQRMDWKMTRNDKALRTGKRLRLATLFRKWSHPGPYRTVLQPWPRFAFVKSYRDARRPRIPKPICHYRPQNKPHLGP